MNPINELGDILKKMLTMDGISIQTAEIEDNKLNKIKLGLSDYYLYVPRDTDYNKIYSIKRIAELFLNENMQNIENGRYLAHFSALIEDMLNTYKASPHEDDLGIESFNFLNGLMDYAIIRNDALLINRNIDKYTLKTSLLKLKNQDEFCMFVKSGEVFGIRTAHFQAVLACNTEIDDMFKVLLKVKLAYLNNLYENEIYLIELKRINLQLEETVRARTMEIRNKNKLLEAEKIKLNQANAKLIELNTYLDSLSRIDPLTRLSNRRDLQERFENKIKEPLAQQRSLIIGDVDHFKSINDNFGHDCGDQVLIRIASIMTNNIRNGDLISRYGGEEFVIFLNEADYDYSSAVVERLRRILENEKFEYNGEEFHVTMSFGFFNFQGELDFARCFKLADQALYKAKKQGRNKVVSIQYSPGQSDDLGC